MQDDRRDSKPERWEVVATSLLPNRKPVPLESQMNAMFGGALFRERTRLIPVAAPQPIRAPRRPASTFVKLLAMTVALGVVSFVVTARRLEKSREYAALTHDLAAFLRTGELRQADELLDRARSFAVDPQQARAMAPLMARAEATLYRYVDGSEERRKSVETWLALTGEGTFDAAVARALITPDAELVPMQGILRTIAVQSLDPEAAFLFGVSLAQVGRRADADKAYARAVDLEPSHLPHLAHYAVWVSQNGRKSDAIELVDQMRTIDPESPWIAWVEDETK
jgi:tetratricopeptide (TPR) repeat protein